MAAIELGTYLKGTDAERYHDCLEACVQCVVACEVCAEGCLHSDDVKERLECIRLCRDTTELCVSAVIVLSRGSDQATEICRAVAETCERCASECEKYDGEMMRRCAEACRRSAEECRRIAA